MLLLTIVGGMSRGMCPLVGLNLLWGSSLWVLGEESGSLGAEVEIVGSIVGEGSVGLGDEGVHLLGFLVGVELGQV